MKLINTLLTILFISLLSSPSWSATLDDLDYRNGLFYNQFTDIPFSGKVTGNEQGSLKNGERVGDWVGYHDNGQLNEKGNWKNDKRNGVWVIYNEDGTVGKQFTGIFNNGVKISD